MAAADIPRDDTAEDRIVVVVQQCTIVYRIEARAGRGEGKSPVPTYTPVGGVYNKVNS